MFFGRLRQLPANTCTLPADDTLSRMKTVSPIAAAALFLALPFSTALAAQSPCQNTPGTHCGLKITQAANAGPRLAPFTLDRSQPQTTVLRTRSVDQMSSADQQLLAANSATIASRAGVQGFHLTGQGSAPSPTDWQIQQMDCPALPDHLLLRYQRDVGTRSESSFTVALPRTSTARLHLVPVERAGYSLYTPSRHNRLTIVVFNDLLREDHHPDRNDWLGLALCYAALAGERVQPALNPVFADPAPATAQPTPNLVPATLSLSWKQNPEVSFVASNASSQRLRLWTLHFQHDGQLRKVSTARTSQLSAVPARGQVVDLK